MNLPSGKRILSAIQPTGVPHIGNYLGAIRQWVDIQNAKNECFWFVADLHAITAPYEERAYRTSVLTTAAALLASGIDTEKSTVFIQSHVPAHTEGMWLLMSFARIGELSRMTQFKEKGSGKESASAGLFTYPVLQAADILLYRTDVVPVGEDQEQHLELSRELARRFNSTHGPLFTEPQPYVLRDVARVMSLTDPTKKMSKSGDPAGAIFLTDTPDEIQKKLKTAVTDSGTAVDPDNLGPALKNLFTIHAAFSGQPLQKSADGLKGKGYAVVKQAVADVLVEKLSPIQKKMQEHLGSEEALLSTLQLGARRASEVAVKTLRDMKDRMGFTQIS